MFTRHLGLTENLDNTGVIHGTFKFDEHEISSLVGYSHCIYLSVISKIKFVYKYHS